MEIEVEGLGLVTIEGNEPNEVERAAILKALGKKPAELDPNAPLPLEAPRDPQQEFGTLRENFTPTLTQQTGLERSAFEAAGATAGGVIAAPAGPATALGGAALGAGAGSAAFDAADTAARMLEGSAPRNEDILDPSKRALQATKDELLFTGGAMTLIPLVRVLKPLIGVKPDESIVGKVLGVTTPEAKRIADLAHTQNIPLGAIQTTERKTVKGFSRVLGIFPFVGTPIKESNKAVGRAIGDRFDDVLNTLAPNATAAELGVDLTKAAKTKFGKFRTVSGSLYERFFNLADNASVKEIIPTKEIRVAANKIAEDAASGSITLGTGKTLGTPVDEKITEFLGQIADLPERLTVRQARELQRTLGEVASEMAKDGRDLGRVVKVKKALEVDLNSPLVDQLAPEEGKRIVDSLATANSFYAENIKKFQTPTARRFERIDKNIFKSGPFKAGTTNEDEAVSYTHLTLPTTPYV